AVRRGTVLIPAPAAAKPPPPLLWRLRRAYAAASYRERHGCGELPRVRHRELDLRHAETLRPRGRPAGQVHARLRAAADLDLLPREVHAGAERLPDRLLRGEAARVVLRRVRLRVAVRTLALGEAALLERIAVPRERAANAVDLDQVHADLHKLDSSQSGSCAIDETIPSGCTFERSTWSGRNLPVRTRTVFIPYFAAPTQSP